MPRREPVPRTIEDRTAAEFEHDFKQVEDRLVMEAGAPADAKRLSEREEDEVYLARDLSVDHDALAERLVAQGLTQEEAEALAVVQARPDWLPLFMQATNDLEAASQLATMAEYPERWGLFADMDDPGAMVAKAERLARRNGGPPRPVDAAPLSMVGG